MTNVGSVSVTVVPEVKNFVRDLRAKLEPEMDKLGEDLGRHFADKMKDAIRVKLDDFRPDVKVDAKVTGLDQAMDKVREKAARSDATVPVKARASDVTADTALARIQSIAKRWKIDADIGADAKEAAVDAAREKIERLVERTGLNVDIGAETNIAETEAAVSEIKALVSKAGLKAEIGTEVNTMLEEAQIAKAKAIAESLSIPLEIKPKIDPKSADPLALTNAISQIKAIDKALPNVKFKMKGALEKRAELEQIAEAQAIADAHGIKIKIKPERDIFGGFGASIAGGLAGTPWWLGPAVGLLPAAGTLLGGAAGAGAALGGAALAGGGSLAAFGAVAKPVLSQAQTAADAVQKAQQQYAAQVAQVQGQYAWALAHPPPVAAGGSQAAIATAGITKGTAVQNAIAAYNSAISGATTAAQRTSALRSEQLKLTTAQNNYSGAVAKAGVAHAAVSNQARASYAEQKKLADAQLAQQKAITLAYAEMSPQQIALSQQIGALGDAWTAFKQKLTPDVAGAAQPWFKALTDFVPLLTPIIQQVSPVIANLGSMVDKMVTSPAFGTFTDFIAKIGALSVGAFGKTLIDFFNGFIILLPQFTPMIRDAITWIGNLGPAFLKWSQSKSASDDIKKFMQWFKDNGPTVGTFLLSLGRALASLVPGLTAGGALELSVIKDFLNWIGNLPKGFAAPLAEAAGAALVLSKLPGGKKVISFGVNLAVGLLGWLYEVTRLKKVLTIGVNLGITAANWFIQWVTRGKFPGLKIPGIGSDGGGKLDAGAVLAENTVALQENTAALTGKSLPGAAGAAEGAAIGSTSKIASIVSSVLGGVAVAAAVLALVKVGLDLVPKLPSDPQVNADRRRAPGAGFFTSLPFIGGGIRNAGDWVDKYFSHPARAFLDKYFSNQGITNQFDWVRHEGSHVFADWRHDFAQWNNDARREVGNLFDGMRHETSHVFADWRHDIAQWTNDARREVGNLFDGARHEVSHVFADWRHDASRWFDVARHDVANVWDSWRHDAAHWADVAIHSVEDFFTKTLPGLFKSALSGLSNIGGSILGGLGGLASKAWHAITGNAAGTPSALPGWSWVGEKGPELVRFNGGEQVMPHAMSVAAASGLRGFAGGAGIGYDDELAAIGRATLGVQREHLEATRNQGREFGRVLEGRGRSTAYRSVYGGR